MLEHGTVVSHELVIGELVAGNLSHRSQTIDLLRDLPLITMISHEEVVGMVEAHRLFGRGMGWIDLHLLAAAKVARVGIWTTDARLNRAAAALGLGV